MQSYVRLGNGGCGLEVHEHREVREILSAQDQPEYVLQTTRPIMGAPRRVRVKGMEGVDATVVVTVVQGKVWLSISPPFTWEAIMEPGKVDEVISMLELARDEAKKVAAARNGSAFRGRTANLP